MLGPADLEDWTFDERDLVSGWLRRQDAVHAVVTGQDVSASAFPPAVRALARAVPACPLVVLDVAQGPVGPAG